ncbi:MAG: hypothetical protein ACRDNS_11405 [Trebonia sp.]
MGRFRKGTRTTMRIPRRIALWGGAAAFAAGGFAFMASNVFTGPHFAAGAGSETVSGYTISTQTFTACGATTATNPEDICYVHFVATPTATGNTAGYVYVRFSTPGGTTAWNKCTGAATYTAHMRPFTCDLRTTATGIGPQYPGTVTDISVSAVDAHKP